MSFWLPPEQKDETNWPEPNANPQNTGVITAPTPEGSLAWERTDISVAEPEHPTEVGGMVVVGHNGTTALDAETGETLWNSIGLWRGHVDRDGMIIGLNGNDLVALDRANGSELWRHQGDDDGGRSGYPAVDLPNNRAFYTLDGEIFVTSADVYGVDTRDGSRIFHDTRGTDWISDSGVGYDSGQFFFGTDHNNSVVANSATDGAKVWESASGPNNVNGGPTIHENVVYYLAGSQLTAVDAGDGSTIWTADAGHFHASSPSIVGDTIVTSQDGGSSDFALRGWNRADGSLLWEFTSPTQRMSRGVALSKDGSTVTAYVYGEDGNLWAVNVADGSQRWKYDVRGPAASANSGIPIVTDKVYVGDDTRFIAVE